MNALLFSIAFCLIGLLIGWVASEKYQSYLMMIAEPEHEFENLFESNPHPELFDSEGNLDRGDYMYIQFPPGFDPENDSGFEIIETDPEDDQF